MSEEQITIPPETVRQIENLRRNIEVSTLQYQLLLATVERDYGFRFGNGDYVKPDGTVVRGTQNEKTR